MTNFEKHNEMLDKLGKIKNDSVNLEIELYTLIRDDEIYEKIAYLIFRLSEKKYPVWRECMTTTIERLKNGDTLDSIVTDLKKRPENTFTGYLRHAPVISSEAIISREEWDKVQATFKTNLARIRKESGLTQPQLSERSGINVRMIQHYEQGVKDINKASALTVYKLAEALGTTVGELLEKEKAGS